MGRTPYQVNDRLHWSASHPYSYDGCTPYEDGRADFLHQYLGLAEAAREHTGRARPFERFWAINAGENTRAIMADDGVLFTRDNAPLDLMELYRIQRRIEDPLWKVLDVSMNVES